MVKAELIKQSPLRILDASTHGGVGKGNLGVLAARQGTGKTAALVHLATDKLLQGKHVIHVTFAQRPDHIIAYYEEIFTELSKLKHLDSVISVHDDMIRNRMIINFNGQATTATSHVIDTLKSTIKDGGFVADTVIVDEYDFAHAKSADIKAFKEFAASQGVEIWFSISLDKETPEQLAHDVPEVLKAHIDDLAVLINLKPTKGRVHLALVKDHGHKPSDLHLLLDPKTLLIDKE